MQEDVIQGLTLGAEDYIVKPFDADELILRLKNILKRSRNTPEVQQRIFAIGNYQFDPQNMHLSIHSSSVLLTEKESQLLHYLCIHQNRLIKRTDILSYLWKEADFFNGRSMDVFISRLRKYLAEDPNVQIENVRGVGFRFLVKDKTTSL